MAPIRTPTRNICSKCCQPLMTKHFMTCSSCKIKLHLDTCSIVTDSHYCRLSAESKAKWKCAPCIRKNAKLNMTTPVRLPQQQRIQTTPCVSNVSPRHLNVTLRRKGKAVSDPITPQTRVSSVVNESLPSPSDESHKVNTLITEIRDLRVTITKQLTTHETKIDNLLKLFTNIQTDVTDLSNKFDCLRTDVDGHFNSAESIADEYSLLKATIQSNNEQVSEILMTKVRLQHEISTTNQRLDIVEEQLKQHPKPSPADCTVNSSTPNTSKSSQRQVWNKDNGTMPSIAIGPLRQKTKPKHQSDLGHSSNSTPPLEATKLVSQLNRNSDHNVEDNAGDWQVYRNRKSKRVRQEAIKGCGQQLEHLQTVERTKKLHACFFKSDTTPEAVIAHMEHTSMKTGFEVQKLKLKHDRYASFLLTIPESMVQLFLDPESWPKGTEVREWFHRGAGRATYHNYSRPHTPGRNTTEKGHAESDNQQ